MVDGRDKQPDGRLGGTGWEEEGGACRHVSAIGRAQSLVAVLAESKSSVDCAAAGRLVDFVTQTPRALAVFASRSSLLQLCDAACHGVRMYTEHAPAAASLTASCGVLRG